MIQEAYVSFETAELLKEKGFNESCWKFYDEDIYPAEEGMKYTIGRWNGVPKPNEDLTFRQYAVPTQQMAMRWLREVHGICLTIGFVAHPFGKKNLVVYETRRNKEYLTRGSALFGSYEECAEAAIKYCLKHLIDEEQL